MRRKKWKAYEKLELAGLFFFLLWLPVERFWPEQKWLQALILLAATVVLGAASVLHWRLPKTEKEQVQLSWRGAPVHLYLFFLTAVVASTLLVLGALSMGHWGMEMAACGGIAVFLLGRGMGYWQYFRQKHGKKRETLHAKKKREDPWE